MRKILFIFLLCFLQGCSTVIKPYDALPEQEENQAQIPRFPGVRAWGDTPSKELQLSAIQALVQEKNTNGGKLSPQMDALALSGGGPDGAFGAGFLCGWTKTKTRPQFKIVTGISTGALIAPFAFLGPAYDARLKQVYTSISDESIYTIHSITSFLMALLQIEPLPSVADNQPLANLIAKNIDQNMLQKIAIEHKKGRRLLVGTTQLNAQRLVIWDMGAIASKGTPEALALFHKILLASASLPASFPPQYFTVEANGKHYSEMHVDGGIEAQVMLYENAIQPFSLNGKNHNIQPPKRTRKLFIIRNQKVSSEWEYIEPRLRYIAIRAIDSLTKSQSVGDLYRLYTYAQRDHVEYNLAYIPREFREIPKSPFDNAYMQKLFALGYKMGSSNYAWYKYPPDFQPKIVETVPISPEIRKMIEEE